MQLFLLTALTMTAFAANSVLNRWAVGQNLIDPVSFALVRLVSGAFVLAVLLAARRILSGRSMGPGGWLARTVGAASLLVYLIGFSLAYRSLDAGMGALVLFGMVQITMFIGALIGRENLPARRWVGSSIAFLGLIYLLAPGGRAGSSPTAALLMATAGIGWGVYSLSARNASDPLAATAWNFMLAVPVMLAVAGLVLQGGNPVADGAGAALAILSGAVTSGLGYALWYRVLPLLGAARGGVAQLTVPVIALAGGIAFLGEVMTLRFLIACVLVLGGVAFAMLGQRRGSGS
ncbi:MAG: DMT family transporter [Rhodobacteraceae bacterium]|nr:DMT family transporter [Paracoccaceae bacterium]